MCQGRVTRRLSASLGFLAVAVDVVIRSVQTKSAKLDSGSVELTISRHPHCLLLIQDSSLVAGGSSLSSGLDRGSNISARQGRDGYRCASRLVLLLRGGQRSDGGAGGVIPRISSCAGSSIGCGGLGDVEHLFKIRFGQLILGRQQNNFGLDDGRRIRGSRMLVGFGGLFEARFGLVDRFGGRERFEDFSGFCDRRLLRLRGRLGGSRLSQHAGPSLLGRLKIRARLGAGSGGRRNRLIGRIVGPPGPPASTIGISLSCRLGLPGGGLFRGHR